MHSIYNFYSVGICFNLLIRKDLILFVFWKSDKMYHFVQEYNENKNDMQYILR